MHLPQPNRKKNKTFHSSEPDTDIQISRVADLDVSEQNFVWLYLAVTSEWLLSEMSPRNQRSLDWRTPTQGYRAKLSDLFCC